MRIPAPRRESWLTFAFEMRRVNGLQTTKREMSSGQCWISLDSDQAQTHDWPWHHYNDSFFLDRFKGISRSLWVVCFRLWTEVWCVHQSSENYFSNWDGKVGALIISQQSHLQRVSMTHLSRCFANVQIPQMNVLFWHGYHLIAITRWIPQNTDINQDIPMWVH